ncbi:hypothetical protein [Gordonibacter pamelaeae]|uniref:Lipoprotein n=1 Tax=Gordonibacter pamelaeae 7-10-1-b TaxID=657308 RepID=D6E9W3_9ACTN|nr:hypothetical protein [Gordonibacter pamelaeae]CBL04510.1 hypothetical protein GPA_22560 [Gordonibacter pamelaeae 7-10-1-b]
MKKIFALATALAISLCMFGCGSSITLDRTVAVKDMTINVPSNWEESGYATGDFAESKSFMDADTGRWLGVYYTSKFTSKETPEEKAKKFRESHAGGDDFHENAISETVIDGAKCTVYEYSYTINSREGKPVEEVFREAYIYRSYDYYEVSGYGCQDVFDAALKSIKLS